MHTEKHQIQISIEGLLANIGSIPAVLASSDVSVQWTGVDVLNLGPSDANFLFTFLPFFLQSNVCNEFHEYSNSRLKLRAITPS